jgi:hypothetical protein
MKKMFERKKQTEMSLTKQCTIILVVAVVAFGGGGTNCSQKTLKTNVNAKIISREIVNSNLPFALALVVVEAS